MAIRQKPGGRWSVYYNEDGKRREEYFGHGPDAKDAAWRRNEELGLGKRARRKPTGSPFKELARTYYQNKNFSENSLKQLKIRLKATILPFFGNKSAIKLVDQDLDDYVKKRRKDGVKYSSIDRELTDVKAILNFAAKRRPPLIPYNPVRDYRKPGEIDREEFDPPTLTEAETILEHASPHVARAIKLSWHLGLRPGAVELFSLTWPQVSWENRTIRVISAKKGNQGSRLKASRLVPVHDKFYDELKSWYEMDNKTGPIVHFRGKAIKSIKKAWSLTLEDAGITRRIRPYDMRHFFITRALENGADIKALAEVVGSSPKTIMKHYQHVTLEAHRKTVSLIPELTTPVPAKRKKRGEKSHNSDKMWPQKCGQKQEKPGILTRA
jgi:integrase